MRYRWRRSSMVVFTFVITLLVTTAAELTWTNWDKREICHPLTYTQPTSEEDIVAVVKMAYNQGQTVRVVGAGHSFSPIALTDGYMLNLDLYNAILNVDSNLVTVQAGIRLYDLNSYLETINLAMPNLGAISQQSIAGATQTSTHGTGATGSIATTIRAFTMVLANGINVDLFAAGRVGLGCLGILSTVTIQTVPLFKLKRVLVPYDLNQLLKELPELLKQYDRLQWYWTPYTTDASLLLRIETNETITGCWPPDIHLKNTLPLPNHGSNISCVDVSYKAMTGQGDDTFLYTEMEMFVPVSDWMAVINDFISFQDSVKHKHNSSVPLFTGVRYVKSDDIWLSPMYERDIAVVSFITIGDEHQSGNPSEFSMYGHGLQNIATKYGGRPHWGKVNYWDAKHLSPVYPKWSDFLALRESVDSTGVFVNPYICRILGI